MFIQFNESFIYHLLNKIGLTVSILIVLNKI